jgi:hypothetical protein
MGLAPRNVLALVLPWSSAAFVLLVVAVLWRLATAGSILAWLALAVMAPAFGAVLMAVATFTVDLARGRVSETTGPAPEGPAVPTDRYTTW